MTHRLKSTFLFLTRTLLTGGLITVSLAFVFQTPAFAATGISSRINYQARLMDPSGFPVADGNYSVKFSLYDAPSGGTRLWTASGTLGAPTAISVSVQNGLFTVLLGDTGQNTLDSVNWNQDAVYLGVTIAADAEMSPRKLLASAPQAFNARQLNGMYASSSVFGTSSLFTLNQTSNTAATGTRTTLQLQSSGTSNANDFLVTGVNDLGSTVFSINRQGNATTSNLNAASIVGTSVSSTNLFAISANFATATVMGKGVCLSDGTNCTGSATSFAGETLAQVSNRGSFATTTLQFYNGFLTASSTVTSTLTVLGSTSLVGVNFTAASGASLFATSVTAFTVSTTNAFVNGQQVCLANGTNCQTASFAGETLAQVSNRGSFATSTLQLYGGFLAASSTVTSSLAVLGAMSFHPSTTTSPFTITTPDLSADGQISSGLALVQASSNFGIQLGTQTSTGQGIASITMSDDVLNPLTTSGTQLYYNRALDSSGMVLYGSQNIPKSQITLSNLDANVPTNRAAFSIFNYSNSSSTAVMRLVNSGGGGGASVQHVGNSSPEGSVYASIGSIFFNTAGSASGTQAYLKTTNTSLTGWRGIATTDMISASVAAASDWVYTATGNFLKTTTSTSNVVIGGTSTTLGFMNPAFSLNGNDLFVGDNIGAASSVYTNGEFVAGPGSTHYGNGYINKNDAGAFQINSVSGTAISNGLSQLWSSGTNPQSISKDVLSTAATKQLIIGNYAYVVDNKHIQIFDISNPNAVENIGDYNNGSGITDIAYDGNTLYVTAGATFRFLDISNPTVPTTRATRFVFDGIKNMRAANGYLYASTCSGFCPSGDDLTIYQLTTSTITSIGTRTGVTGDNVRPWVRGNSVFTVNPSDQFLYITDATVPTAPVAAGSIDLSASTPGFADLVVNDRYAFITDNSNNVLISVDAADISAPAFAATSSGFTLPTFMSMAGRYLYIADESAPFGKYQVVDITNGYNPTIVNTIQTNSDTLYSMIPVGRYGFAVEPDATNPNYVAYDLQGTEVANLTAHSLAAGDLRVLGNSQFGHSVRIDDSLAVGHDLTVGGQHVCLADGENCQGVTLPDPIRLSVASQVPEGGNPFDVAVDGNYMYVADGAGGLMEIFDISNAENPVFVATTTLSYGSNPAGIVVKNQIAYVTIGSTSNTLDIIDVSDPFNPTLLSTYRIGSVPAGLDVDAADGLAFVAAGSDKLLTIDVSDPTDPAGVATTTVGSGPINVHVNGHTVYVTNFTSNDFSIVDATDPLSPSVVGTISGLAQPTWFDVSNGYAYVANSTFGNNTMSIIDVHDPSSPFVVTSTFVGIGAGAIQVSGHYAYISNTNSGGHHISVVDIRDPLHPEYMSLNDIGYGAYNMVVSGRYLYTANYFFQGTVTVAALVGPETSDLYATRGSMNDLSITHSLDVGDTVTVGGNLTVNNTAIVGTDLIVAGQSVCLANGTNCPTPAEDRWFLSPLLNDTIRGGAKATVGVGLVPQSVAFDGKYIWVANYSFNSVSVVDIKTNTAIVTVPVGTNPIGVAFDGSSIWVTNSGSNNVSKIDVGTFTVVATVPVGTTPEALAFDGSFMWVVDTNTNDVKKIDITANSVVATVGVGTNPIAAAFDGTYIWAANYVDGTLSKIDVNSNSVVGTVPVGTHPDGLAFDGTYMWAANNGDNNVSKIDVSANSVVATTTVGSGPYGVAFDGSNIWVANNTSNSVSKIDVKTNAVVKTSSVGSSPLGLAFDGSHMWVTNSGSASVSKFPVGGGSAANINLTRAMFSENSTATGTSNYQAVINYTGGASFGGLCIDDNTNGNTCPTGISNASILADNAVTANAFDLAEVYSVNGSASAGDLLILDQTASATVKVSTGVPYDGQVIGVVSTKPGFVLGWNGGVQVALTGRVPLNVSMNNGPIHVGDPLVSSDVPGYAMRATRPGMVVGYALEDASATGTAEVFVNHGFWAGDFISATGTTTVLNGDVAISGKFFPPAKGGAVQTDTYLFVDNTIGPTSTYISTNANGWQSNDTYDFAERYYSPDELESGDLVVVSDRGQAHVQRAAEEGQMLLGIVSTRPAFIAGAPATSTYPIALSGRVPTKISTVNGAIKAGDPITATTIPGVGAKAVSTGPIIGQALEDYDGADVGKIEVFVNPSYWVNKSEFASATSQNETQASSPSTSQFPNSTQGFANIRAGSKHVHVSFTSLGAYPIPQVTARGEVIGGWWTDSFTDTGFDIILKDAQDRDVQFAWRVDAAMNGNQVFDSDGTYGLVDPTTGVSAPGTSTTTQDVIPSDTTDTDTTSTSSDTTTSTPDVVIPDTTENASSTDATTSSTTP